MNRAVSFGPLHQCPALNTFRLIHRDIEYPMNPVLLSLASTVVANRLQTDPSFRSLVLPPLKGPIEDFITILFGEKCQITVTNCRFLNYMGKFLEVDPLVQATSVMLDNYNVLSDIVRFGNDLIEAGLDAENEVNQIAANIAAVKDLTDISPKMLKLVISSNYLKVDVYPVFINTRVLPLLQSNVQYLEIIQGIDFSRVHEGTRKKILGLPLVDLNKIKGFVLDVLSCPECGV